MFLVVQVEAASVRSRATGGSLSRDSILKWSASSSFPISFIIACGLVLSMVSFSWKQKGRSWSFIAIAMNETFYELKGFTMWWAAGKMRDGDPGKGGKIKTMLASDRQTPSSGLL